MLDVNFEFVNGVLFVRLMGKINYDSILSVKNNLKEIIMKGGIKYLVFNLDNSIIEERVSLFDDCNNLIKKNNGMMYICGYNNNIETLVSSNYEYCGKVNNELNALRAINIC